MPNLPYHSSAAEGSSSPFGGKTLTIGSSTYRALNWKPEKNTRKIRRNDTNGDQAEFQIRAEPTTQSGLTLQLALASTTVPSLGAEFTDNSLTYVITKVGEAHSEGEFWTVDIDYEGKALPTD